MALMEIVAGAVAGAVGGGVASIANSYFQMRMQRGQRKYEQEVTRAARFFEQMDNLGVEQLRELWKKSHQAEEALRDSYRQFDSAVREVTHGLVLQAGAVEMVSDIDDDQRIRISKIRSTLIGILSFDDELEGVAEILGELFVHMQWVAASIITQRPLPRAIENLPHYYDNFGRGDV